MRPGGEASGTGILTKGRVPGSARRSGDGCMVEGERSKEGENLGEEILTLAWPVDLDD